MEATHVGLLAGFLTTLSLIPQLRQIYRTKSAKDVSLPMFVAFTVGVALWLLYGIMERQPAIILWNSVTVVLAAAILAMKIRFG